MLKFPQIRKGRGGGAGGAQAWGKGPGESWAAWGGLGSFWGGPVAAGGGSWARLGVVLGRPGVVLGPLGRSWWRLGVFWGTLSYESTKIISKHSITTFKLFGVSAGVSGTSRRRLWGSLGAAWGLVGALLGRFAIVLGGLEAVLARLGCKLVCLGRPRSRGPPHRGDRPRVGGPMEGTGGGTGTEKGRGAGA